MFNEEEIRRKRNENNPRHSALPAFLWPHLRRSDSFDRRPICCSTRINADKRSPDSTADQRAGEATFPSSVNVYDMLIQLTLSLLRTTFSTEKRMSLCHPSKSECSQYPKRV